MQSSSTSMPDNNRNFNWYEYETSQIGRCLLPDAFGIKQARKEETREFFRWLNKYWIWEEEMNEITQEGLESGLESLPDYLAEKIREDFKTDC